MHVRAGRVDMSWAQRLQSTVYGWTMERVRTWMLSSMCEILLSTLQTSWSIGVRSAITRSSMVRNDMSADSASS